MGLTEPGDANIITLFTAEPKAESMCTHRLSSRGMK